jgi:hypothetical protein
MESAKLNALRYRSTRYHPTHLRANTRISDINPPEQHRALRFRLLMGNARAKRISTQVVENSGGEGNGCYRGDIRRPHPGILGILSEDEAGDRRREIAGRTKSPWKLTS